MVLTGGDLSNELVRHFLIECTQKGVRLKGCPNEPYFGEYLLAPLQLFGTASERHHVAYCPLLVCSCTTLLLVVAHYNK